MGVKATFLKYAAGTSVALAIPASSMAPASSTFTKAECQALLEDDQAVLPIDAAALKFSDLKPKGEFESTADYKARTREYSEPIVTEIKLSPSSFEYDADRQVLKVADFGWTSCIGVNALDALEKYKGRLKVSPLCVREYGDEVEASETYTGQNSYGATAEISVVKSVDFGVFVDYGAPLESAVSRKRVSDRLFQLSIAPDAARSLKENGAIRLVVRPKAPFYAQGSSYLEPTIRSPIEKSRVVHLLVGDIECYKLVDQAA